MHNSCKSISMEDVIRAANLSGFDIERFDNRIIIYGHHRIREYEEELILSIVDNDSICEQIYQKYRTLQQELIKSPSDYGCMRLLCMLKFMKAFKPVLYDYEKFPSDDNVVKIMIAEIMAFIYGIEILEYGDEYGTLKLYCFHYDTKSFGKEEYSFLVDYEDKVCKQVYAGVGLFHPLNCHKISQDRKKAKVMADELSLAAKPLKQYAHDLRTIFNEENRKDWMHDFTDYLTDKDVAKRNELAMDILRHYGYTVTASANAYMMSTPEIECEGHDYLSSGCLKNRDALAFVYSFLKMFSEKNVKDMIENDPVYFEQLGNKKYVLSLPSRLSLKADKAKEALDRAFYKWNDWA